MHQDVACKTDAMINLTGVPIEFKKIGKGDVYLTIDPSELIVATLDGSGKTMNLPPYRPEVVIFVNEDVFLANPERDDLIMILEEE